MLMCEGLCTEGEAIWWSYSNFITEGVTCNPPNIYHSIEVTTNSAKIRVFQRGGATNYKIQYKRFGESVWTIKTIAPTSTAFDLTDLLDNTYYDFKIRSVCGTTDGSYYESGNFTTVALPCKIPTALALVPNTTTTNSAKIQWTGITGNTKYAIQYKKTTEAWGTIATEVTPTAINNIYEHTISGLEDNTDYEIRVKTVCSNVDESEYSAVLKVKTTLLCRIPQYTITDITMVSFRVVIPPVTGAIGYEVSYRIYDPTKPTALWIAKNPIGANLFTDITGLTLNTKYEIRIRTNCGTAYFSEYGIGTVTTLPCSNVLSHAVKNITLTSARIEWAALAGAQGYEIEYKLRTATTYIKKTALATATFVDITGLTLGTLYDFRIRAKCTLSSFSAYLNSSFTTLPCSNVLSHAVKNITITSARIEWATVAGAQGYEIEYKLPSATTYIKRTALATATFIDIAALAASTRYDFRIRTKCTLTGFSDYLTGTFTTLPCSNVLSYAVKNIKTTSVRIEWPAKTGVQGYEIEYKLPTATTYIKRSVLSTATFVDITLLTPATVYDFRIRVKCSATGFSDYSNSTFTTTPLNDEPCAATVLTSASSICTNKLYTTLGATYSPVAAPTNVNACITDKNDGDIWFRISIPTTKNATIRFTGVSLTNYRIALYDNGTSCATITPNNAPSCVNLNAISLANFVAGKIFYLRLWGADGTKGTINICMTNTVMPASPTNTQITTQGGTIIFSTSTPSAALVSGEAANLVIPTAPPTLEKASMIAYPNPVRQSELTVEYWEIQDNTENITLELLDITGKMLIQNKEKAILGMNQFGIKLPQVANGVYFLKLQRSNQTPLIQRIQVMR